MIRLILTSLSAFALLGAYGTSVQAQPSGYPDRPVRIVVPSGAGGGTDTTARILAERLSQLTGEQFVVENRPGAAQMIGIEYVSRAPADGYTLLVAASPITILPAVNPKVRYDLLKDFAPITQLISVPSVLVVNPGLGAKTLKDYIAMAKAKPGVMNYASAGAGTQPHMAMELLKAMAGLDIQHVPFKGVAPAVTEVLAGRLSGMFINMISAKPQVDAGKLLAVANSDSKRSSVMPDVPTVAEAGVDGYEAIQWFGLFAPAGTPDAILDYVHKNAIAALQTPEMKKRLAADGAEGVGNSRDQFVAMLEAELVKWVKVAEQAKLR